MKGPLGAIHGRLMDVLRGVTLAELFDPPPGLLSLLPVLAPRARLWGLVFLTASVVLSLATLPLTVLQLKAVFGFGARPLRLDYLVFLWALVPVLWVRERPFEWLRPRAWRAALGRLRPEGPTNFRRRVRNYLGLEGT